MINTGLLVIIGVAFVLAMLALQRDDGSLSAGLRRALEQSVILLPRLVLAFMAASLIVRLIPTGIIANYLGSEAGIKAILIGALTGVLVPAGPSVAVPVAAAFALEGASVPGLVAYLTGWSVFAAHRVLIYEIPMLGARFVRLRLLCALPLPLIAGALAMILSKP
jgi:uncharacterized membrane protein YraQ (UPF0718 family)